MLEILTILISAHTDFNTLRTETSLCTCVQFQEIVTLRQRCCMQHCPTKQMYSEQSVLDTMHYSERTVELYTDRAGMYFSRLYILHKFNSEQSLACTGIAGVYFKKNVTCNLVETFS